MAAAAAVTTITTTHKPCEEDAENMYSGAWRGLSVARVFFGEPCIKRYRLHTLFFHMGECFNATEKSTASSRLLIGDHLYSLLRPAEAETGRKKYYSSAPELPQMVVDAVTRLSENKESDEKSIQADGLILCQYAVLDTRGVTYLMNSSLHFTACMEGLLSSSAPVAISTGLEILSALCWNQCTTATKDIQPRLAHRFGTTVVALLSHPHVTIRIEAARALWNLCYGSRDAQDHLALPCGGVAALADVLTTLVAGGDASPPVAIVYACMAVKELSLRNHAVAEKMVEAKIMDKMVAWMSHSDSFVQMATLSALCALFAHDYTAPRNLMDGVDEWFRIDFQNRFVGVVEQKPMARLSELLRQSTKPDVLTMACKLVVRVCWMNGEAQQQFVEAKGPAHLVHHLNHPDHPLLQRCVCMAIMATTLQSGPAIHSAFTECKTREFLMPLICKGGDGADTKDQELAMDASFALATLAGRSHDTQRWIVEKEIIHTWLQWLPLGEADWKAYRACVDGAKHIHRYKLALHCIMEATLPESVLDTMLTTKRVKARGAYLPLLSSIWERIGLEKMWILMGDLVLAPPVLVVFGYCSLQHSGMWDQLVASPYIFKLLKKLADLSKADHPHMKPEEEEKKDESKTEAKEEGKKEQQLGSLCDEVRKSLGRVSESTGLLLDSLERPLTSNVVVMSDGRGIVYTPWTPIQLSTCIRAAATTCLVLLTQEDPRLVKCLLRLPEAVDIVREQVKNAESVGKRLAKARCLFKTPTPPPSSSSSGTPT